jgi:hypothetical protein
MSRNDFDWNDTESVIIHDQPSTAVYLNERGQVVIRQAQWPDDDSFVYVSPEFVGVLARAVMDAAEYGPDEAPAPRVSIAKPQPQPRPRGGERPARDAGDSDAALPLLDRPVPQAAE